MSNPKRSLFWLMVASLVVVPPIACSLEEPIEAREDLDPLDVDPPALEQTAGAVVWACGHTAAGSRVCAESLALLEAWGIRFVARVSCADTPAWCDAGLCCSAPPGEEGECQAPTSPWACETYELFVLCASPWAIVGQDTFECPA
jgi:hypothetical protein